jgi:hypothetical protein
MKTILKPNLITLIIIVCILVIVVGNIWAINNQDHSLPEQQIESEKTLIKPIDAIKVSDTIRYYNFKYNQLKDSVKKLRYLKNGSGINNSSYQFAYLGTQTSLACDTCSLDWLGNALLSGGFICDTCAGKLYANHVQHYIKLYAWTIQKNFSYPLFDDESIFYVNNSQGYLRKAFDDTSKHGRAHHQIYIKDVPVKFRYDDQDKALLIPVTKSGAGIFKLLCRSMRILYVICFLMVVYLFIRFAYDVSRGLSFTYKNVLRLRFITLCVIAYPVVVIAANLLIRLVFNNYFTADVILKDTVWTDAWDSLPTGILFLALYIAFSKALVLKQEQDLTI